MKLLVDIGNSRIKTALLQGGLLEVLEPFAYQAESLTELLSHKLQDIARPGQVFISNVAGDAAADGITAISKQKWGVNPVFAVVEKEYNGLVNAYDDLGELGVDRWLAMIAAWSKYHAPVCVVDCGTAVTIDSISAAGRHLGGLIIPGPELMQQCLNSETYGIDTDLRNEFSLQLGSSTTACIANGAAYAIASVIDRVMMDMITAQGTASSLVLTGGDAGSMKHFLRHEPDMIPALVLNGLADLAGNL